jgi:hypothetical protein
VDYLIDFKEFHQGGTAIEFDLSAVLLNPADSTLEFKTSELDGATNS